MKNRARRTTFIVLAIAQTCVIAATRPLTTPSTWRENFQSAELGQFASYPPVQDVGYDPSIAPTSGFGAPGGRALMRVVKPVSTGPERFGFVRRLDLIASNRASLSFSYRLDGISSGDRMEIGIAASNGTQYTSTMPAASGAVWRQVHLRLADMFDKFGAPPPMGVAIDGLHLVAALFHANPDITYRFLIADLSIQAEREARFELRQPKAITLEPRHDLFATVNWESNGPLNVEALAPVTLTTAECILKDQDGSTVARALLYDDGTHGDRSPYDGIWSNHLVPHLPVGSGIYKLLLNGTNDKGLTVGTTVRMVRSKPVSAIHPRLYFSAAESAKLVERSQNRKYVQAWMEIAAQAKLSRSTGDLNRASRIFELLDREYLLPTLPGYFDLITKAGSRIQYNALMAYVSGDREALAAAKEALRTVAKWQTWAPPWFPAHGQPTYYPAGELTAEVAFGYDLVYNQLSPEERALIREGLIKNGILPAYREYVLDNRVLSDTSNWISHSVAGALLAAAAIKGDGAAPDLDLYTNGLLDKLEGHLTAAYLPAGIYGETISYQEFDLETLAPALIALNRVFGIDYWRRSHVKDSLWYPISTLADPIEGCLDIGDTHCPSGRTIAPVVAQSQNPVFRWYQDHFAPFSLQDFLFSNDALESRAPPSPGSRYFPRKGIALFRSGWQPEDAILLFRAGPNFNHNHADQGSFLLRALGENLIAEGGYADYYKDPYYDSYFKQAAAHNTVLVDGSPASQNIADTLAFPALQEYPRITNVVMSVNIDAVDSELQQVYRGRLRRFVRRIVFIKPDYVVVYDELVPDGPAAFDWLLHFPNISRTAINAGAVVYRGNTASVAVRFLSPDQLTLRVTEGHLPYTVFNPVAPRAIPAQPAVLNASTPSSSETVRFIAAVAPARTPDAARQRVMSLHRIDTQHWTGVARDGPASDRLLFCKAGPAQPDNFESWTTAAAAWFVRSTSDSLELLAGIGATSLKRGDEVWFASEQPASFVAAYKNGQVTLSLYSTVAQTVGLRKPNGQLMQVGVEAGSHEFKFGQERRR